MPKDPVADHPKRVLLVAANPAVSPVTGWRVGFWWAEADAWSDPRDESRYSCIRLRTRLSGGDLLVKGRTWTGLANSEEQFADDYVGRPIQPFRNEDEARALPDTNFVVAARFRPHAIRGVAWSPDSSSTPAPPPLAW